MGLLEQVKMQPRINRPKHPLSNLKTVTQISSQD